MPSSGDVPGTYLGSNANFNRTPNNNKKRPISPEQVLRLFGNNHQSNTKLTERSLRSPASSPPSTTHQSTYRIPYGPSLHELCTRTVTMVRDPADGTQGFGICVKGGKDSGRSEKLKPATVYPLPFRYESKGFSLSNRTKSST